MAATVTIRRAGLQDAEALSMLTTHLGYPTPEDEVAERLRAMEEIGGSALVAEMDGRIVGMATMQQTRYLHRPNDTRLSSLVVEQDARGAGIGRLLVEEVARRGARAGCARLELTSGFTRSNAHAFYEHLGFETQSRRFVKTLDAAASPAPHPDAVANA